MWIIWFRSTGVVGGVSVQALLEIWVATSWPSIQIASIRLSEPRFLAARPMFTPESSKKPIILKVAPVASSIRYKFKKKDGSDLSLYWMDGGIMPERFEEIDQMPI